MKFSFWNIVLSIVTAFVLFLVFTVVRHAVENPSLSNTEISENTNSGEGEVLGEQTSTRKDVKIEKVASLSNSTTSGETVSGEIRSAFENTLTALTNGSIEEIAVTEGERIKKGDLIIDLSGNEENQQILLQKKHLQANINDQQKNLTLLKANMNTQYSLNISNIDTSVNDLKNQLAVTKTLHNNQLNNFEKQIVFINAQIAQLQSQMTVQGNVQDVTEDTYRIQLARNISSLARSMQSLIRNVAIPIAEELENEDKDYRHLPNDLEEMYDNMVDWGEGVSSSNITSESNDFLDNGYETINLFDDVIEGYYDMREDFSDELLPVLNSQSSTLSQSLSQLQTQLTQIETAQRQIENTPLSNRIPVGGMESQLLSLQQARQKMQDEQGSLAEQFLIQENQIQTQINSLTGNTNIAEWQLDSLRANRNFEIAQMESQITQLKQKLDEIDASIEKLSVIAPYDAIVDQIFVKGNQDVAMGMPLVSLFSPEQEVVMFVDANDAKNLRVGNSISFNLVDEKEIYKTTIEKIAPKADARTKEVMVYLKNIPNTNFIPNSAIDALLAGSTSTTTGISIPTNSIIFEQNTPFVFVYDAPTDSVKKTKLKLGKTLGANVEVLEGLNTNQDIITEGQHFLTDGEKLTKVVPETPKAEDKKTESPTATQNTPENTKANTKSSTPQTPQTSDLRPQTSPTYTLSTSSQNFKKGETVSVDLTINTLDQEILSGQVYLSFDPKLVSISEVQTTGSVFSSFIDQKVVDNQLHLTFTNPSSPVKTSKGKVVSFKVKLLDAKTTTLAFIDDQTIASAKTGKDVIDKKKLEDMVLEIK